MCHVLCANTITKELNWGFGSLAKRQDVRLTFDTIISGQKNYLRKKKKRLIFLGEGGLPK